MTDYTARLQALTSEPSRDDARNEARLGRVGRTLTEMKTQGSAITETLASAAAPLAELAILARTKGLSNIAIFGCGDSWFAGMAVRHAMEAMSGLPVIAVQALEHASYPTLSVNAGTLAIGISSGGNTPAVMQALAAASAAGATPLALTNTAGSPITRTTALTFMVCATRSGWPTQATTATMALLCAIADAVGPQAGAILPVLSTLADQIDAQILAQDAPCQAVATKIAAANLVLFTGLGPNFAAASIGAAKVRELSPTHAFAIPLEEVHHYRSFKKGDPVIILATDPAARERAFDTVLVAADAQALPIVILAAPDAEFAARALCLSVPKAPAGLEAFLTLPTLHRLAHHMAVARADLGLGAPRNLAVDA